MPPLLNFSRFIQAHWLLLFAVACTVTPFWVTVVPPSTDLPQHLSQLFLLEQTLAGERPALSITPWYYPNTLIYWLAYAVWLLADPITAGRLILSALALSWVAGTYLLCVAYKRPKACWLIGVPLVFNFLFTWGFLNFLVGWPLFCIFLAIIDQPESPGKTWKLVLVCLMLYYAHALWFLVANVCLGVTFIGRKPTRLWRQLWPILPAWLLALWWYPDLAASRSLSGVDTSVSWEPMPWMRLQPDYLVDSVLGSIHAGLEPVFCLLIGGWLILVFLTRRQDIGEATNRLLLAAACVMVLLFLATPSKYMNTMFFSQRWLACGVGLLLLALPAPRLPQKYLMMVGGGILALFSAVTVRHWQDWENEHLEGFLNAIVLVDKGDRVIGLNLSDGSLFLKGRPGLHLFAYAQVLRGAEPHFSFTEHYSGVVQFRQRPSPNPYPVWSPAKVSSAQIKDFDKILVNGDEQTHALARKRWSLVQIGEAKTSWRVYRNAL